MVPHQQQEREHQPGDNTSRPALPSPPLPGFSMTGPPACESTPLISAAATDVEFGWQQQQQQQQQQQRTPQDDGDHNSSKSTNKPSNSILYDEVRGLVTLAVPVVATFILEMLPGIVSIMLVGHIHIPSYSSNDPSVGDSYNYNAEELLDATALAVMFGNITAMSIGIGLSTALDTLCSQAFGANETKNKVGTYLQTGIIVLSFFFVCVVCVLFYHCTSILLWLGQPIGVSQLTGTFALYLLPGIPFLFGYELLKKVLQAQNVATPMLYVAIVANVINAGLGYYLVYYTSWGWIGAAIARTVCNISYLILLIPYTMCSGLVDTFWNGLQLEKAISGIPEFLALGVPGMLQLCFEWWAFEVLSLLCGILPNAVAAIGANAVILNIGSMTFMFTLGLSISCNVRVGNALGAGDPERARLAANLTIGMSAFIGTLCATFLIVFRTRLPSLFTHDETIGRVATTLIGVAAVFQIPDAINGAIQGIFRGSGRQTLGAKLNFVAYYLLGIPLGCFIAFNCHVGIEGLWMGITIGLIVVAGGGIAEIYKSDWVLLAKQAKARVKGQS